MNPVFESLTGLTLLDPGWLLLALLVPFAAWARFRRRDPAVEFAPGPFLTRDGRRSLPRSWRQYLVPVPRSLQLLALVLAVVALARPARRVPLPLETEGIDIVLCLDTSSSMTADDMDARRTRLEVAKDAAARFVTGRSNDRIGLIRFARYPDVRCPPTLDHRALKSLLGDVETVASDGPEDATGIGTAVARAAQLLDDSVSRSRVVILLTDGEENVATQRSPEEIAPVHAAQLCKELGVRVYTIAAGVGRRDASGGFVLVDTGEVQRLSERTGGTFFEARDAAAVAGVYRAIDELEKAELDEPRHEMVDAFLPFLVAAAGLLLAGRLLETTALGVLP